jgi:hypothetical protein
MARAFFSIYAFHSLVSRSSCEVRSCLCVLLLLFQPPNFTAGASLFFAL